MRRRVNERGTGPAERVDLRADPRLVKQLDQRDRLPADLRDGEALPQPGAVPFVPLYLTDDELALEIANKTVHGVLHLGWVRDDERGGYRGQMAVLVRPNGLLGKAYMAAITPFRYLLVYPPMLREFGRRWRATRP